MLILNHSAIANIGLLTYRGGSDVVYRKPIRCQTSRFVRVIKLTVLFHTKICGVRLESDIAAVGESGADAIGLNFFPLSIRYVDPLAPKTLELARIAQTFGLLRVGVFVNRAPADVDEIAHAIGIDVIQLHGDESLQWISEYRQRGNLPVLRAIKLPTEDLTVDLIENRADPWIKLQCGVLFDAEAGAAHGGSGKQLDWNVIGQWAQATHASNWTLAGGLHWQNVAQAKQVSGAKSVDTASGVEEPKGIKSPRKIQDFAAAAMGENKSAWDVK